MRLPPLLRHPVARQLGALLLAVLGLFLLEAFLQDQILARYELGGPASLEIQARAQVLVACDGLLSDLNASRALLLALPASPLARARHMLQDHQEVMAAINARFARALAAHPPEDVHLLLIHARAGWGRYARAVHEQIQTEGAISREAIEPFVSGLPGRQYVRLVEQIEAASNVQRFQTAAATRRAQTTVARTHAALRGLDVLLVLLLVFMLARATRTILESVHRQARLARYEALRADVTGALASPGALEEALQRCGEALARHLDATLARIWLLDPAEEVLQLQASAGASTRLDGPHGRIPLDEEPIGRIARDRQALHTEVLSGDRLVQDAGPAPKGGRVAFTGHPLLLGTRPVGVLAVLGPQPLHAEDRTALGAIADALAQGIERRRAELALEKHAADLARSNADLEQFAYVASHDLQEPLRMVASYTSLLDRRYRDRLDADANDFIGFAVDGARRMQRLVNDLLAYSRVGTRELRLTSLPAGEVVSRVLRNLDARLKETGAEVIVEPLPKVKADDVQLEQLLQNLIANAIKFRGERPSRVNVSAERQGEREWRFAVKDNGIGIEPQYFQRIFLLFQRLHTQEHYAGTGIGLAVCKKIVEHHGGRIWVESTPGEGSTFFFTLQAPSGST